MRRLLGLLAVLVVLPGCGSGPDGSRAYELLQQADAREAALESMSYRARLTMSFEGQKFVVDMHGAAVLKGPHAGDQWVKAKMPELPGIPPQTEMTMVLRNGEMSVTMAGHTERMAVPELAQQQNQALGSLAALELARCVDDVRVAPGATFHGEPATRVAGVVDTGCVLDLLEGFSGLGGAGAADLNLDELSDHIGDIRATLFISDRSQLCVGGSLAFSFDAEGERVAIDLSYRLKDVNKPVRFPG